LPRGIGRNPLGHTLPTWSTKSMIFSVFA